MTESDSRNHALPPDASFLHSSLGLQYKIIGFYDIPSYDTVPDVIEKRGCLFSCFQEWQRGRVTHISRLRPGCPGCACWVCGNAAMQHDDFLDFLVNTEGLKTDREQMQRFLDAHLPYVMEHRHILIGPLMDTHFNFCRTVTIFCNPDQLSAFIVGINRLHQTGTVYPLLPGVGPGCYQLSGVFPSFDDDYAVISSTDIAMRIHLPENVLSLTVTTPLFSKLCALDAESFLGKSFWTRLVKLRGAQKTTPSES
ncbi:MAG: DUF169 domain-containing protein [Chitinispirillaceae bacterium]|nr:DUF169 domain-containing protein [Chitinispirillaceae bacterium]